MANYELIMTVEQMQDEKAWLELRKSGIGGSDAGAILGLNRWKSPFSLWLEKTEEADQPKEAEGDNEGADEKRTRRLKWGKEMEEFVANLFCETTGKKVRRCGMIRSKDHPFMLADIDRVVIGENALLECKTTSSYNKKDWADGNIPDTYYCQVVHYMAVGGYDKAYVACLIGAGEDFIVREINRDDEEIKSLIEAEEKFWNEHVIAGVMPDADGTTACTQTLAKHFPGGDKEEIIIDGEHDTIAMDLLSLKADQKQLELLIKEKENLLKQFMGNNEVGVGLGAKISYGVSTRKEFDSKAFLADHPEWENQYIKQTSYRRLVIKSLRNKA